MEKNPLKNYSDNKLVTNAYDRGPPGENVEMNRRLKNEISSLNKNLKDFKKISEKNFKDTNKINNEIKKMTFIIKIATVFNVILTGVIAYKTFF